MKLSILIKDLNNILIKNGDCDVFIWNNELCEHNNLHYAKYVYNDMLDEDLMDIPEYENDFNKILHNVIIK